MLVARALVAARAEAWPLVFSALDEAVMLSRGARWDLALADLAVRRYPEADALLADEPASYEVEVARGVALRGQGRLDDAEAAYRRAIALDGTRLEAHFDLGVLLASYRVPAAPRQAADEFRLAHEPALADRFGKR